MNTRDITLRHQVELYGTSYYIDNNGWCYIQKQINGPLEPIQTARLKWYQKIWFKIKYVGKNYILIGDIDKK